MCTADEAAIICAAKLGLKDLCLSVEEVLRRIGFSRDVKNQYSKKRMDQIKEKVAIQEIYDFKA